MDDITENLPSVTPQGAERHKITLAARFTLLLLALLTVSGSGALLFYRTNVYPAELKTQATAVVNTLLTMQAQATATNLPQLLYTRLTRQSPSISTSLANPENGWVSGENGKSRCTFTGGAYRIHVSSQYGFFVCWGSPLQISDFVFQVHVTLLHATYGGIFFRSASKTLNGYTFGITSNGLYTAAVLTTARNNRSHIIAFGRSAAVLPGPNQSNLLTVIARGKHFLFYINRQFVESVDENTFTSGLISLFATRSGSAADADVAFHDAQLWSM